MRNIKMVKGLVLSRRTRLEFVNLSDDARLNLAADELERLVITRFASKAAPDQRWRFSLKSKRVPKVFL
jgi:hypothetical protein